jgi:7-carboxy-7-deazaguanine synthase
MIPVNEVFETFQGEAFWTGTPSVFLRLQSCGVGCPWCDTKHTWELKPENVIDVATMADKLLDAPTYARMTVADIMGLLGTFTARHIVITGGEPCLYDLTELTQAILASGRRVQIETSGTQPIRVATGSWVTVSPKIGMPGGFKVLADALARADEVKLPVGKMIDIERLDALLVETGVKPSTVWLQPLSQSDKATALCVDVATARDYRVSLQVHKYLGVR